jgi:hypothetical protein
VRPASGPLECNQIPLMRSELLPVRPGVAATHLALVQAHQARHAERKLPCHSFSPPRSTSHTRRTNPRWRVFQYCFTRVVLRRTRVSLNASGAVVWPVIQRSSAGRREPIGDVSNELLSNVLRGFIFCGRRRTYTRKKRWSMPRGERSDQAVYELRVDIPAHRSRGSPAPAEDRSGVRRSAAHGVGAQEDHVGARYLCPRVVREQVAGADQVCPRPEDVIKSVADEVEAMIGHPVHLTFVVSVGEAVGHGAPVRAAYSPPGSARIGEADRRTPVHTRAAEYRPDTIRDRCLSSMRVWGMSQSGLEPRNNAEVAQRGAPRTMPSGWARIGLAAATAATGVGETGSSLAPARCLAALGACTPACIGDSSLAQAVSYGSLSMSASVGHWLVDRRDVAGLSASLR